MADEKVNMETSTGPALQAALDEVGAEEAVVVDTTVFEEPAEGGNPYPPGVGPDPTVSPSTLGVIGRAQGQLPRDQQAALRSVQMRQEAAATTESAEPTTSEEGDTL